jgi:peptidoglycan/LPS O-acetylase OafA/YrhL
VHLIAITACYRYLLNPTDLSYLAMLWALLVCVAVSLLASLVVYLAIERPFMGLRSWVAARSPPRASAQAPQVDEDRQVQQRQ